MQSVTEPIVSTFRKCAAVMKGGDLEKRLTESLAEVERLRDALADFTDKIDACDAESDTAAFSSPHNIDKIRPVQLARQRGWIGTSAQRALEQVFQSNPEWRQILKRACEAKLAIIESDACEVERKIRHELSDGFTEEEICSHPRLRRMRRGAAKWKALSEATQTEKNGPELWARCLRNL